MLRKKDEGEAFRYILKTGMKNVNVPYHHGMSAPQGYHDKPANTVPSPAVCRLSFQYWPVRSMTRVQASRQGICASSRAFSSSGDSAPGLNITRPGFKARISSFMARLR